LRGLRRTVGVSPTTVINWLKKVTELDLKETVLYPEAPAEGEVLELDELWSFVLRTSERVWNWLTLCRHTRQVVAFVMGFLRKMSY
jgi:insertion element IS1 protein InsB